MTADSHHFSAMPIPPLGGFATAAAVMAGGPIAITSLTITVGGA